MSKPTVMHNLQPVYQKPGDLKLIVTRQDWTRAFTILCQDEARFRDLLVSFCIIGESHITTIWKGECVLVQEILACTDFTPESSLCQYQFGALAPCVYNRDNYRIEVRFESGPEWVSSALDGGEISMEFPAVWGETPHTRIQWWQVGNCIHWRTLHLYPEQNHSTYVHTASTWRGING